MFFFFFLNIIFNRDIGRKIVVRNEDMHDKPVRTHV